MAAVVVQRLASDGRYVGVASVGSQSKTQRPLIRVRVRTVLGVAVGDIYISIARTDRRSTSPRMPIVRFVKNPTHRAALATILAIPAVATMAESRRCTRALIDDSVYDGRQVIGWDSAVSGAPYMDLVITKAGSVVGFGAVADAATPTCVLRGFGVQADQDAVAAILLA
jgi:hypothetical protein